MSYVYTNYTHMYCTLHADEQDLVIEISTRCHYSHKCQNQQCKCISLVSGRNVNFSASVIRMLLLSKLIYFLANKLSIYNVCNFSSLNIK